MIQDQRDILEDIMQYGIDSGKIMTTILTIIPPLEPDLITPGGIQAARVFLWASERGYKTVLQKLLEEDLYFKSPSFFEILGLAFEKVLNGNHPDCTALLLQDGADPRSRIVTSWRPPMNTALVKGFRPAVLIVASHFDRWDRISTNQDDQDRAKKHSTISIFL
jgi:hypothetical protein